MRSPGSRPKKPLEDLFRRERVGRICSREPATAYPQTPLAETLRILRRSNGAVVIVERWGDRLKPAGIFTERDYLVKIAGQANPSPGSPAGAPADIGSLPTERFMTPHPRTLTLDDDLEDAIRLMTGGGYRHLPIVDGEGSLAGILSVRNIIVYLAEMFPVECINRPPRKEPASPAREGG